MCCAEDLISLSFCSTKIKTSQYFPHYFSQNEENPKSPWSYFLFLFFLERTYGRSSASVGLKPSLCLFRTNERMQTFISKLKTPLEKTKVGWYVVKTSGQWGTHAFLYHLFLLLWLVKKIMSQGSYQGAGEGQGIWEELTYFFPSCVSKISWCLFGCEGKTFNLISCPCWKQQTF